jgi:hypothetical protein
MAPTPPALPALPFGNSLVAYVDILGFKGLVGPKLTSSVASVIAGFTWTASDYLKRTERFTGTKSRDDDSVHITFFSDTIVFSCVPVPDEAAWLVFEVQHLCSALLSQGLYTRGGITVGGLFHKDATIVGPALIEAHQLEQEVAKYPRIIVADSAIDLMKGTRPDSPSQARVDLDGLTVFETFPLAPQGRRTRRAQQFAAEAKAKVEADLARTRDRSQHDKHSTALGHRAKYGWILRYLESVLAAPVFLETESSKGKGPTL